jgi:ABC-type multidrug transport system ATPase subunit
MNAITVHQISRRYGAGNAAVQALRDVSFEVAPGELFGLIGPDGAGKTTLIRILTTLLLADRGTATVDSLDVVKDYRKIRQRAGYMPGKFSLYPDLTVAENLAFFATLFGTSVAKNYDLIKDIYVQIEPFKERKAGKLSGGMKQKLALCCALIHRPSVLLLDEPSTGVDAVSRREFWEMLKRLAKGGITMLVSTPYMDEASLCDRVALMQAGSLLTIDSPKAITRRFGKPLWAVRSAEMYRLLQDLRAFAGTGDCYPFGEYHHLVLHSGSVTEPQLRHYLAERGHRAIEIKPAAADIEDSFIALMKAKGA